MIVCSCSVLTKARIIATAEALAAEAVDRPITPGRLFRALGTQPQCGTCFSLIRTMVAEAGLMLTCPEPLASQAEEGSEADVFAMFEV